MNRIKEYVSIIKADENIGKKIFTISFLTALFVLALVVRGPNFSGRFIVNEDGNVVGIQRSALNRSEEYKLSLVIIGSGERENRDVTLRLHSVESDNAENDDEKTGSEYEMDTEIKQILSELELSKKKRIELPVKLSNGYKLKWKIEKNDYSTLIIIPCCYFMLLALVVKSAVDNGSDDENQNRRDIMRALPRFTNQLLLMLSAGMILSDAFEKICNSYSLTDEEGHGYFEKSIMRIYENNTDNRVSTANLISEFATKSRVKEFIRIATILTENERRGSDVIDNLSRESIYLWDERKITARECGKLIDTRMSYPLGILLVLLIVITMAPAILSM